MLLKSKDFRDLNQPGSYEQPLTMYHSLAAKSVQLNPCRKFNIFKTIQLLYSISTSVKFLKSVTQVKFHSFILFKATLKPAVLNSK